jgi:hypothetical protein
MKKFIYIFVLVFLVMACDKDEQSVHVTYRLSNSISDTDLFYRNIDGQIVKETVLIEGEEDVWTKPLEMNNGDIVYLSAIYYDSISSVKIQILVDGKVYKEASSNMVSEKYVTISGTVPY